MSSRSVGDLRQPLHEHFGFDSFRGPQEEICNHVLDGDDAVVIMATGDGKSLCYQLPAMVNEGLTLVVSPLIALMDDQVHALQQKGLPAARIHSNLSAEERRTTLARARDGEFQLLYVTPERFRVDGFLRSISDLEIDLFAVDEAHCLSHWGHDFRPGYQQLGRVRASLGSPPTIALTATATEAVQKDIRESLGIPEARLWHTGIDRPNLFLAGAERNGFDQKLQRACELVERISGPKIVYTALIKELRAIEEALLRKGHKPLVYHGALSPEERRQQQARFLSDEAELVLATPAFGMGVDKKDIRLVFHWQMPKTLEAYYQEIGRAGRDGQPSLCEICFDPDDLAVQRNFVEWANPSRDFLTRVVTTLAALGDRASGIDEEGLRIELGLEKRKQDGRVGTALRLLRTAGITEGELGRGLRLLRVPDTEELDEWVREDKHDQDLRALLTMLRYAQMNGDASGTVDGTECRQQVLNRHFGLPDGDPCGVCDAEQATDEWLEEHFPPASRATPRPIPEKSTPKVDSTEETILTGEDFPVERGQWIKVRGQGLCAVTRVFKTHRGWRAEVERARDLKSTTIDLWRGGWQIVE
ncbi:MAG: ATP-dependent DNA helicase RecQ [Planctomycetota bacterium]